jgi:hypothetical protein
MELPSARDSWTAWLHAVQAKGGAGLPLLPSWRPRASLGQGSTLASPSLRPPGHTKPVLGEDSRELGDGCHIYFGLTVLCVMDVLVPWGL